MKIYFSSLFTIGVMMLAFNASATTAEDVCGVYNANVTILDREPFGNVGADWTPVTLDKHDVTVTAEGNTLTFSNFFDREGADLVGEFNPENATIVFQPQTILGDYTFCGYPTGDWWMDNKLTEAPTTLTATYKEGEIKFDMWSIVKGEDVLATNFYSSVLTYTGPTGHVGQILNNTDTNLRVYNLQGILVSTGTSVNEAIANLPAGIYIVNGKKILKR